MVRYRLKDRVSKLRECVKSLCGSPGYAPIIYFQCPKCQWATWLNRPGFDPNNFTCERCQTAWKKTDEDYIACKEITAVFYPLDVDFEEILDGQT